MIHLFDKLTVLFNKKTLPVDQSICEINTITWNKDITIQLYDSMIYILPNDRENRPVNTAYEHNNMTCKHDN